MMFYADYAQLLKTLSIDGSGTHLDPILIDAFSRIAEDFNRIRMSLEDNAAVDPAPADEPDESAMMSMSQA